ncbi:MAG TPA: FAD-binding oxidoreductase [Geminicoccaceae bacterium]|nr:FAD-binding oxidoreductase [Geminicoccaceae bacterium]
MPHTIPILKVEPVTHDVRRFTVRKPQGYRFEPGQATLVSIDRPGWQKRKRPFTFTSLNDWPDLEFTTKIYPDHHGVTEQLGTLQAGDGLLLEDPWGTIQYKGSGTFIAGGAGVTPFIAILRQLARDGRLAGNTLLFSNKTARDIILRDEFEAMEGLRRVFTVTHERAAALESRRIDRAFLQDHVADFGQHFYVCGPKQMVEDLKGHLEALGARADAVVFEE